MKKFIKQFTKLSECVKVYTDFGDSTDLSYRISLEDGYGIFIFDPDTGILVCQPSVVHNGFDLFTKYISLECATIFTNPLKPHNLAIVGSDYGFLDEITNADVSINVKTNSIIVVDERGDFFDDIVEIFEHYKDYEEDYSVKVISTIEDFDECIDLELPKKSSIVEETPTKKVFPF